MAKSNTNKRYALRKLGKIFGSVIIGLTLFLGGVLNTSFVHADGADVTSELDDNFETQDNRKDIPYETIYERDDNLPKGTKETKTPGKKGIKATVKTYSSTTLQLVSEKSDVVILQPQTEVIKVGTKPTVVTETISSLIRYIKDATRPVGSNVLTESDGEDGLRKITTTYDVNDKTGEVTIRETTSTIEKESKDIIYKVAAKDKVEKRITEKSTNIRFEKDETKDRSENPVTIDGEDGTVTTTTTYDVDSETGKVTEKVTVDRKEPTDTVIKVPAKSKVEEVLVPFTTKYEADNDLSAGQEQEITLGKNGKTVTTITYDVDGKSGQVTESTLSQKEDSQTRVVKKGTKPQVIVQVIPIETEYLDDPTLDKGQEIEEAGEIGEITLTTIYTVDERDGTIEETTSRQITKEMVKRRIRRGTREPEKVVVPKKSSIPSYPVSVTSNQGTDAAVEPAKPVAPTTGWKQENGMWYFYNTDGSMATGWVQVNGSWYYLNSNGSMATGWEQVDGSWYYLNSNGSMKANQWFQVGGKWYYVNASGELAVNTSIDGYRVNDNGEWVR